jgi:hypothetical protein
LRRPIAIYFSLQGSPWNHFKVIWDAPRLRVNRGNVKTKERSKS